jgi:quinolinate synthase
VTGIETAALAEEVRALARERDAVILAHNYQLPEVQDVADYVGDSLGLSRQAAATDAETILFCGVHFMAETAAILSPEKTVLIPDLKAGCSLAASIDAAALRDWKAKHPGAVVVSYVNTTAEVKAESDYCCTSNARAVVEAILRMRDPLLPDMYLGPTERVTGRKLTSGSGVPRPCRHPAGGHRRWQAEAPDAELLVHPECGCASQAMAFANDRTQILSTEGMVRFAKASSKQRFVIATETGILHRLSKEVPEKEFVAAREAAVCRFMKMITLEKTRDSLREMKHVVTVDPGSPSGRAARSTSWSPSVDARCTSEPRARSHGSRCREHPRGRSRDRGDRGPRQLGPGPQPRGALPLRRATCRGGMGASLRNRRLGREHARVQLVLPQAGAHVVAVRFEGTGWRFWSSLSRPWSSPSSPRARGGGRERRRCSPRSRPRSSSTAPSPRSSRRSRPKRRRR